MKIILIMICVMLTSVSEGVELHTGLNGPWHQPENPGQGLVLHIIPESNQIFIAWFTYEETGGKQMWLTAQGSLDTNPINLEIYESTGGMLNTNQPPPVQTTWGTGTIEFQSCAAAVFNFNGSTSGTIALSRITAPLNCSEVR
ncbi:MAG: hypothetical protein ACSHWU_02280 [Marinicella sp.]